MDNETADRLTDEIAGLRMMLNEHAQAMGTLDAEPIETLTMAIDELKTEVSDLASSVGDLQEAIEARTAQLVA